MLQAQAEEIRVYEEKIHHLADQMIRIRHRCQSSYKRRIIFWYDEDQEFMDKLDEITVNGAKLIALTGTNHFYVKKLLAVDAPASNYLVYSPLPYESLEDDWLLDMELYSEEFRADLVSMWMDEMGIPQTPALRRGFKQYRKFFNAQTRRNRETSQTVMIGVFRLESQMLPGNGKVERTGIGTDRDAFWNTRGYPYGENSDGEFPDNANLFNLQSLRKYSPFNTCASAQMLIKKEAGTC